MISLLLAVALNSAPGAFPIPGDKGQQLDAKATHFHLPHQLAQVERFYRAAFKGDAGITFARTADGLSIRSTRTGERWSRAILKDDGVATTIEVTPLIAMDSVNVQAEPPPVATLVIERSAHVQEQLDQISADHAPTH